MLKTLPFKEYLDFAVVFCILFEDNNNSRATSLVSNDLLDKWEITTEELFEQAMTNMKFICPAELKSMNETMVELLLNDDNVDDDTRSDILKHLEEDDTNYPMYVLTNTKKCMVPQLFYMKKNSVLLLRNSGTFTLYQAVFMN